MCPACFTTAAMALAGVTSAGGLMALLVNSVRAKDSAKRIYPQPQLEEARMNGPRVVSRDEWLAARRRFLSKEKEFTRLRDQLSSERRRLPMVKISNDYVFQGPTADATLLDLFDKRRQLIIYHFMFDPSWDEGCPSCSLLVDNIGHLAHLHARNTSLALVSRAPLSKIEPFKRRMGWTLPWYSSFGSSFNYDFHVTLDEAVAPVEYNYTDKNELVSRGEAYFTQGESHGVSVFLRDGDSIFHAYSTYARGADLLVGTYNFLDLTPEGRNEDGLAFTMAWVRHHDKYREGI